MDKKKIIQKETENLLKKMINNFQIEVDEKKENFEINIKTEEEAPIIIGRHGETIRAIQRILEVILFKQFKQPVEILVNINDFRQKQKEKLEEIAKKLAEKTLKIKKSSFIKNLSSYERKIIHEYISSNYPQLISHSEGEGRERKLIIELKT